MVVRGRGSLGDGPRSGVGGPVDIFSSNLTPPSWGTYIYAICKYVFAVKDIQGTEKNIDAITREKFSQLNSHLIARKKTFFLRDGFLKGYLKD